MIPSTVTGIARNSANALWSRFQSWTGVERELTIQLDITNSCNLNCSHCYHSHHQNFGALTLAQWQQVLDQYQDLLKKLRRSPDLVLCGGEPFMSPLLWPVLDEIEQRWPQAHTSILTNGTLINSRQIEKLWTRKISFQVSLDGPDEDSHDAVRGPSSFKRTVRGIKLLKQHGFRVNLLSILSRNTRPQIPKFFETARELDVDSMNFVRLVKEGAGRDLVHSGSDAPLYGLDLKEALSSIVHLSNITGVPTAKRRPLFHLIDGTLGGQNKLGWQGLVVDYKGNLKLSSRVDMTIGNILSEGLSKLYFNHPAFIRARKGDFDVCRDCKFHRVCGGDRNSAFAEYGDMFGPDPGCWYNEPFHESRSAE